LGGRDFGRRKTNRVSDLRNGRERKGLCYQVEAEETISNRRGYMTTDPVCGVRIDEQESEFQTMFAGRKYFFCSEDCRKEFENEPEEYLETAA
jgi:YHS domain-containing protein